MPNPNLVYILDWLGPLVNAVLNVTTLYLLRRVMERNTKVDGEAAKLRASDHQLGAELEHARAELQQLREKYPKPPSST